MPAGKIILKYILKNKFFTKLQKMIECLENLYSILTLNFFLTLTEKHLES